jgi:hypothetical protein
VCVTLGGVLDWILDSLTTYRHDREALSPGVKRPGREADNSPPTSAEVKKNVDLYIHSPIRLHDVLLN